MYDKTLLSIKELGNRYGNHQIFEKVSLKIEKGQFVALVGQSGGGKSTFLRLIAGLEKASSGQILIKGEKLIGKNKAARIMFQDDRLLPWLNVIENLCIVSYSKEGKKHALKLLERIQLSEYAEYYPTQLSGGQRQRVALARALMASPEILLLDEPLGALDALTRVKMQALIAEVVYEEKLATILVTHDVSEAVKMSDQIIVVRDGKFDYREKGFRFSENSDEIASKTKKIQKYILEERKGVKNEEKI